MTAVYYVLVIMVGYFCGCIESGYLVGKLCGMDIRDYGSGNSGTTNVLRVLGKTRALLNFPWRCIKKLCSGTYCKVCIMSGCTRFECRTDSACYRVCGSNGT